MSCRRASRERERVPDCRHLRVHLRRHDRRSPTSGSCSPPTVAARLRRRPARPIRAFRSPTRRSCPGSATVKVGGIAWNAVSSLTHAGSSADDYTLDPSTGTITFGDDVHGAIPPSGRGGDRQLSIRPARRLRPVLQRDEAGQSRHPGVLVGHDAELHRRDGDNPALRLSAGPSLRRLGQHLAVAADRPVRVPGDDRARRRERGRADPAEPTSTRPPDVTSRSSSASTAN